MNANGDDDLDMSAFDRHDQKEEKAAQGDKDKGADDEDVTDEEDKSIPTDTLAMRKKKRLRRKIRRLQRGYQRRQMKEKEEEEEFQQIHDTRESSDKHRGLMLEQRRDFDKRIEELEAAFSANDASKAKQLCRLGDGTSFSVDLFIHTCRRGNVGVVKNLVDKLGFEPNCYDVYDKTGMIWATQSGQTAMVTYLASELKANVNFVPSNGMFADGVTPLMIAVSGNDMETMNILLQENADCNQADHRGRTAVHRACQKGHFEALETLVKFGGDLNQQDKGGNSPCVYAAKFGHVEILRYLVDNGGDARVANKKGQTPFARAAMRGAMEMIDYLMKDCGVSINTVDSDGESPIANAMRANRVEVVKYLALKTRTDINVKDKYGRSPVLLAVVLGNLELVSFFTLECRNFIDTGDWALVYKYAVKQKDVDMIRHLVFNCGYELQEDDVKALGLYRRAVEDSDLDLVQKIVKSLGEKFEVDVKDEENNGDTCLMVAVRKRNMSMVTYLVDELKADYDAKNGRGETVVVVGVKNVSSIEVLDYLINTKECDLFHKDEDGKTVFDVALDMGIRGKHLDVVKLVLVELAEHVEGLARFLSGEKNRRKIQFLFDQKLIPEDILRQSLQYIVDNGLELDPFVLLELKKATKTVSSADQEAADKARVVVRTRSVAKCLMMEMDNDEDFLRACTNIIRGALLNFRPFSDDMLLAVCMYERSKYPDQFGAGGGVLSQLEDSLDESINAGKGSKEYKWLNEYLLPSAVWFELPPRKKEEEQSVDDEKKQVEEDMDFPTRDRGTPVMERSRAGSAVVDLVDNKSGGAGDGVSLSRQPSAIAEGDENVESQATEEEIEKEEDESSNWSCLFADMLLKKYSARMDQEGHRLSMHVFDTFSSEKEEFDEIRTPVRKLQTVYDPARGFFDEMVSIAKYEVSNVDRQDALSFGVKADKTEKDLGYNDANIQFYDLSVNLNQLLSLARQINGEFQDYVEEILKGGLDDSIYDFRRAPVKTQQRCREKCETDYTEEHFPTSARILDLVRCSVTFDHVRHLEKGMEFFLDVAAQAEERDPEDDAEGIRGIARIKNGLAELGDLSREEPIAYKDIKINAIYWSKVGRKEMIVEIQLILRPFLMAKKHMHRLYKVIRQSDVYRIAVPKANEESRKKGIYDDIDYNAV